MITIEIKVERMGNHQMKASILNDYNDVVRYVETPKALCDYIRVNRLASSISHHIFNLLLEYFDEGEKEEFKKQKNYE